MDSDVLVPVVVAALVSTGTVCVLNVLGVVGAKYGPPGSGEPLFTVVSLRNLSLLSSNLFLPCLSFTRVGAKLSPETMAAAWPAFIWSPINVAVGFGMGLLMRRVARPTAFMRREFVMACTFSNGLALPLVLVEVLSKMPIIADEEPDALEKSQTFVFAYSVLLTVLIWGVGHTYLAAGDAQEAEEHRSPAPDHVLRYGAPAEPLTVGAMPLGEAKEGEPLQPAPPAGVSASGAVAAPGQGKRKMSSRAYELLVEKTLKKPTIALTLAGVFVGIVTPLRRAIFSPSSPVRFIVAGLQVVGSASVGCTTLVMAGTTGRKFWSFLRARKARHQEEKQRTGSHAVVTRLDGKAPSEGPGDAVASSEGPEESLSFRALAVLLLTRLVLIPVLCTAIVLAAHLGGILPDDRILLLVLLIECVTPSANMVIILCQELHHAAAAEQLAMVYLLQYLLVPFTLAVFLSHAIYWSFY